jgi:hypothetical protein
MGNIRFMCLLMAHPGIDHIPLYDMWINYSKKGCKDCTNFFMAGGQFFFAYLFLLIRNISFPIIPLMKSIKRTHHRKRKKREVVRGKYR